MVSTREFQRLLETKEALEAQIEKLEQENEELKDLLEASTHEGRGSSKDTSKRAGHNRR
jgi:cell division protein FtsB